MTAEGLAWAGLATGLLVGLAAQYGRLCTMGAIEDALVAGNFGSAKIWALALATAIALTEAGRLSGTLDLSTSVYASTTLDIGASLLGGALFGLGMSLAGTCGFGLLVRAGTGDMRAVIGATLLGIFAFAFTGGAISDLRPLLTGALSVDTGPGEASLHALVRRHVDAATTAILVGSMAVALALPALLDRRLTRRPRQMLAGLVIGVAVALGWLATSLAVAELEAPRVESLTFVAPIGRTLLQFMIEPLRDASFAVNSVIGVVIGSAIIAMLRRESRWEAFDDPREMRRHLIGAALMGIGGVLARGCTIGQGLSAGSTTALSTPIFIAGLLIGAKIGLDWLLEGRWPWHAIRRWPRRDAT